MSQPSSRRAVIALSRARNTYVFVGLLIIAFLIMSKRAGIKLDGAIPHDLCNRLRLAELLVIVVGLIGLRLIVRRLTRSRAEALGDAAATFEHVAEDFVKAATLAAFVLAVAAFIGLIMLKAEHRNLDVFLLILPVCLMVATFPTQTGMKRLVDQVNGLRGLTPPEEESGGEPPPPPAQEESSGTDQA